MKFLIIFIIFINLHANTKEKMFNLYQQEKYKKACILGYNNFYKYRHDEKYNLLLGFACLKSDYIDRLTKPIINLNSSREARANAAYFSTILMQKKLLYYALVDGYNLSDFKFPTTDYILSKVFDLYSKLPKHEEKNVYILKDPENKKLEYKLYLKKSNNITKMVIEEYYDSVQTKHHTYW